MMELFLIGVGVLALIVGSILGYLTRQSVAKRNHETLEARIQKKVEKAREEAGSILLNAREESHQLLSKTKKEADGRSFELLRREKNLLRRENILDEKYSEYDKKEKEMSEKIESLKKVKSKIESLKAEADERLEKVSGLSKEEAKNQIFKKIEDENQLELMEKIRKIEKEGWEKYEEKAKEILSMVIQKCAISQTQEITTTTISLPNEDIKGKIIGKEGRNIKTLEKLTGVEIIVDDTPETVIVSSFDPVRRQIAKIALEKLIRDGRIQPARIEEIVSKAESEIVKQIKDAGETAVYETGVIGLDPKLIQLLGRLKFRTSYGQNVLIHSIEVSFLAAGLAAELGLNVKIAKKAGLLHDIGKALDHQVEGSHTDIGMRILEKFGIEEEVIKAVGSHHEERPYESLEAILVQTADAISGSRPGARKDNLESYLKRLGELEDIASSFKGVEKSYAISAGREIRIFVKPEDVNDFQAREIAKGIADRIHEELRYPGEIKVTVIRESRAIEYAR